MITEEEKMKRFLCSVAESDGFLQGGTCPYGDAWDRDNPKMDLAFAYEQGKLRRAKEEERKE